MQPANPEEPFLEYDTTLILYAYKRLPFFQRALSYCSGFRRPVIVLDGNPESREDIVDSYHAPNIRYIHRPIESAAHRFMSLLPEIRTPYLMFMPDDCFFFEDSIDACVGFLNSNPDYSAATTPLLAFHENQSVIKYGVMYSYIYNLDINDADPVERFRHFCSKIIYTVQYTVVRKRVWEKFMGTGFVDFTTVIMEMLFLLTLVFEGKIRVVPVPGFVRGLVPNRKVAVTVDEFFENQSFADSRHSFNLRLGRFLQERGIAPEKTIPAITDAYRNLYSAVPGGLKGPLPLYRTTETSPYPEILSKPVREYPFHTPELMNRLMKIDQLIRKHVIPQGMVIDGATRDITLTA